MSEPALRPITRRSVESHGSDTRDPLRHNVYVGGMEMREGYLHLADKPGFGLETDWKAVERLRV